MASNISLTRKLGTQNKIHLKTTLINNRFLVMTLPLSSSGARDCKKFVFLHHKILCYPLPLQAKEYKTSNKMIKKSTSSLLQNIKVDAVTSSPFSLS
jgi:hypothetical protein